MNKLKYIWIVAAMIVALSACTISYKLNGAAIDYSIYKTINVGQFPIRAAMVYAPLQPMFENKLTDTYTKQISGLHWRSCFPSEMPFMVSRSTSSSAT